MRRAGLLSLALAVLLLASGCGQKIKKENEELKAQVAALTGERGALQTQVASLQQELEGANARITTLTAELDAKKQELEVAKAKKSKPEARKKPRR